ncbi:MAG: KpsF/GutQ family sugar-phosphate isomerase [Alphaproteobacteria bacterium]|nr:KpsF/GutQ family sugar-phosphate isomerase [Alphaproteobacteria bacterium]
MTLGTRAQGLAKEATANSDLDVAREVLAQESAALTELGRLLDERFTDAVEVFAKVGGRVIVGGIGKSGQIARKVAATLASTGTPAQFVHPSEASHGDLGMVTGQDAVLLFSKSGENGELTDILSYAKRYSIPLIAITGNPTSTLGLAADVVLTLPDVAEACPMGLAPTTSTTMMMALGDALAVALLERSGFSADRFRVLHPGGRLGASLRRVGDLMRTAPDVPLAARAATMSDVLLVMSEKNFGCAGIVDEHDRLAGIITDGDLRRHMAPGLLELTAGAVMTADPQTISSESLIAEAVALMAGKITNLFVVDDGRVVGIVRLHDCLQAGAA